MRKHLLMCAFVALCAIGVSAQSILLNNPDRRFYLGLRGSFDLSCPGNIVIPATSTTREKSMDFYNPGAGFSLGLVVNCPIVANLYIEPGAKIFYNTYGVDKDYIHMVRSDATSAGMRKWGVRFPLMLGYHFDFTPDCRLFLFTGPLYNCKWSESIHIKTSGNSWKPSEVPSEYALDTKTSNWQWGFGVGLGYKKFYYAVEGAAGLSNISWYNSEFHQGQVSFTIGYNFRPEGMKKGKRPAPAATE